MRNPTGYRLAARFSSKKYNGCKKDKICIAAMLHFKNCSIYLQKFTIQENKYKMCDVHERYFFLEHAGEHER
jgi:hypothetical protein